MQARLRSEAQRGIGSAQHPANRLQRHAGIGQGRNVAIAELPAIGEAGFQGNIVAPLDQLDIVPLAYQ